MTIRAGTVRQGFFYSKKYHTTDTSVQHIIKNFTLGLILLKKRIQ